MEIETDGSVHPKEALERSVLRILIHHFMLFSDEEDHS